MTRPDGGVPSQTDLNRILRIGNFSPVYCCDPITDRFNLIYPAEPLTEVMKSLFPQTADFQTVERESMPKIIQAVLKQPVCFYVGQPGQFNESTLRNAVWVDYKTGVVKGSVDEKMSGISPPRFRMVVSIGEVGDRAGIINISNLEVEITPVIKPVIEDEERIKKPLGLREFWRVVQLFDGLVRYGAYVTIPAV